MGIFEIISAIILIVACVFTIVVVLMKDTKTQMSQTIGGASSDNFFQKNSGRTKEAKLNKATVAATVIFFVLALAVNVINVHFGGKEDTTSDSSAQQLFPKVYHYFFTFVNKLLTSYELHSKIEPSFLSRHGKLG